MLTQNNITISSNNNTNNANNIHGQTRSYNSTFENNNYQRSIVIPQALKNTISKIDQELNENEEIFADAEGNINLNSETARKLLLLECNKAQLGSSSKNRSATMLNNSSANNSPPFNHTNNSGSNQNLQNIFQMSSSSSLPPPQQRNVHIVSSQSFNLNNPNSNQIGMFGVDTFVKL